MIELACETDFVAKNEKFVSLLPETVIQPTSPTPAAFETIRSVRLDRQGLAPARLVGVID